MKKSIKTKELFFTGNPYIKPFLEGYEYPDEAIFKINEYINAMFHERIKGYFFMDDDILMGENVRISPLSVIKGPAIIGANSEICAGAVLDGNTIIGENCVIGNSTEIKNCVLCDGVRLARYNYVGNSILGDNVVFDASVVCAYINEVMDEVGGIFGDDVKIGCGCVLNAGTIIPKGVLVGPLSVLDGFGYKK